MSEPISVTDILKNLFRVSGKPQAEADEPVSGLHENTLNKLFTDWRKPDGKRKADEAEENMDYPSFSRELPYRLYDPDSGLFLNDTTLGFVLECTPLIGANDKIVDALDYFLRNKLPRKVPLTLVTAENTAQTTQTDTGVTGGREQDVPDMVIDTATGEIVYPGADEPDAETRAAMYENYSALHQEEKNIAVHRRAEPDDHDEPGWGNW